MDNKRPRPQGLSKKQLNKKTEMNKLHEEKIKSVTNAEPIKK